MMNFEEYSKKFYCKPFYSTEQSKIFLVERENEIRVCKKFSTLLDKYKEEKAYSFLLNNNLLTIPQLTFVGEDFLEIEYIKNTDNALLPDILKSISKMYAKTMMKNNLPFSLIDLSKQKLEYRINYLKSEMKNKGFFEKKLIFDSESFIEKNYQGSPHKCLVHGDLKSPHIIQNYNKLYYIDLGLVSVASPWYDLAFLFMEKKDKKGVLNHFSKTSQNILRDYTKTNNEETRIYLKSAIFYRTIYDLGFALRHRPKKTIMRVINELKDILKE